MRPIDWDELMERLQSRFYAHNFKCDFDRCARSVILSCIEAVHRSPTICEPPNDPLTLDELREMDGEPAYIIFSDGHQGWAILDIWANANDSCVTLHGPDMESYEEQRLDFLNSYGEGPAGYDGWSAYRRKPEEGPQ